MTQSQLDSGEASQPALPEVTFVRLTDSDEPGFVSMLRAAVREGRRLHIQTADGKSIAILLPRTDYELLNAAAELAGSPAHCASMLHYTPPETVLSVEELFDSPRAQGVPRI
jgi:hypothetical protein